MEVMPGYKQTEVGVIPEDWKVKHLKDLGQWKGGATPSMKNEAFWNEGTIPWASSGDIKSSVITETEHRITEEAVEHTSTTLLPQDSVIIVTRSGILRRYLPVAKNQVPVAINQDLKAIIPNGNTDSEYLLQSLLANGPKILSTCMKTGTTVESVEYRWLKDYSIPFPPTMNEQRAIAAALSDVDALIVALDQLIAKKRDIKQAAMQELLTGKRRLPGFNEEWMLLNMADNSVLKARIGWQGLTTAEYRENGDYYLVTGTDFNNGLVDWDRCYFVGEWRYTQDKNIQLRIGDVLITKDGTIGKVGYIDKLLEPATLNSGIFVIRPKDDAYDSRYFYYILTSRIFNEFLTKLQAGSTISHLYQKDFVNFSFLAPSVVEEQKAIATVLSNMDAEIAALEARRDTTRSLKQGMMQELLTGRIRLV